MLSRWLGSSVLPGAPVTAVALLLTFSPHGGRGQAGQQHVPRLQGRRAALRFLPFLSGFFHTWSLLVKP